MLIGSKGWLSQVVTGRWSLPVSPNGPWPPAVTKLQTQAGPPPMSFECQPHLTTLSSLRLPFQALFQAPFRGSFSPCDHRNIGRSTAPTWNWITSLVGNRKLSFLKFCLEICRPRKSAKGLRRAVQLAPLELKHH